VKARSAPLFRIMIASRKVADKERFFLTRFGDPGNESAHL